MNRKQKKWNIRLWAMGKYLLLCLLLIIGYLFFQSPVLLSVVLLAILFPIASLAGSCRMEPYLELRVAALQTQVHKGEQGNIGIYLHNSFAWMSLHCRIDGTIENGIYGAEEDLHLEMPISAKTTEELVLPVASSYCGTIQVRLMQMEYRDLMGLFTIRRHVDCQAGFAVLPREEQGEKVDTQGMQEGLNELEESQAKGFDHADVTDMREYRPGDRIKDIHWKLSAKKREWMVKEREGTAQSQMVIVADLSKEREVIEVCIARLYSVIASFLDERIPVRVLWWNVERSDFEEQFFTDKQQMEREFASILFRMKRTPDSNVIEQMQRMRTHLSGYLVLDGEGDW